MWFPENGRLDVDTKARKVRFVAWLTLTWRSLSLKRLIGLLDRRGEEGSQCDESHFTYGIRIPACSNPYQTVYHCFSFDKSASSSEWYLGNFSVDTSNYSGPFYQPRGKFNHRSMSKAINIFNFRSTFNVTRYSIEFRLSNNDSLL